MAEFAEECRQYEKELRSASEIIEKIYGESEAASSQPSQERLVLCAPNLDLLKKNSKQLNYYSKELDFKAKITEDNIAEFYLYILAEITELLPLLKEIITENGIKYTQASQ